MKIWEAYHSESSSGSHSQYILILSRLPLEAYCVGHAGMNVLGEKLRRKEGVDEEATILCMDSGRADSQFYLKRNSFLSVFFSALCPCSWVYLLSRGQRRVWSR